MISTIYQVTGMTCEHCTRAVALELGDVPGVSAVTVTLVPGGTSAVTVTSDAPLAADSVTAALDEAGGYQLAAPAQPPARQNPAPENPGPENPALENPALENPALENPALENPALENPAPENVAARRTRPVV